ncbi:GUN4 domain-containing protein [Nostoc sp.]|uniref:GUN4 domain-containing protein n=1 Tax=Nostoc sp. TaxID=1180 RepID=UPI002FF87FAB
MTVLTCTSTSQSITLLGEPKISGEAKVWRTNRNGYLAKIYHDQKPERVQKLAVMIAHRPKEPNSHLNHISFAWPKSVLKDTQGDCVGFLMPEIKEAKELIDVYNTQRRKTLKLEVDWRFLHTTALNIASIIEAIHTSGYVLGDIKPQNILVNDRALPSIIDTDSFQVRNPKNNKVYRCLVGSEGYTPPELIDKDFSNIDQTEVHDRFRLAVIIYQLLFGGESPFAGKWIGAGETPQNNELIRQGLWLYAPNSLIQPVERIIPLEIVHPEVQRCFLKCFNDGYKNSSLRPTAGDWVKALRLAVNELTICGKVDSHYYSRTYGKCYWCDRTIKLGTDIFPGFVRPKQAAVVESTNIWQVASLSNTATSSSIKPTQSQVSQTNQSTNLSKPSRRRFLQVLGLAGVGFGFVMARQSVFDRENPSPNPVSTTGEGVPTIAEVELKSSVGMDYTGLRDYLATGKWKEADEETARVMLVVAKPDNEGYLSVKDIDNFPCQDLSTIDQLWLKYSDERFGFSVQKLIYQSLGGTNQYNSEIWGAFCDTVGWRKGANWLYEKDITFDNTEPQGHLPYFRTGYNIIILFSTIENCTART